jgi:hypothetical protein
MAQRNLYLRRCEHGASEPAWLDRRIDGDMTMLSMTKIVVPLAIVFGSASAALAGPKDAFWPKDTAPNSGASVQHRTPTHASGRFTPAASAYAFASGATGTSHIGRSPETYIDFQTRGFRGGNGL